MSAAADTRTHTPAAAASDPLAFHRDYADPHLAHNSTEQVQQLDALITSLSAQLKRLYNTATNDGAGKQQKINSVLTEFHEIETILTQSATDPSITHSERSSHQQLLNRVREITTSPQYSSALASLATNTNGSTNSTEAVNGHATTNGRNAAAPGTAAVVPNGAPNGAPNGNGTATATGGSTVIEVKGKSEEKKGPPAPAPKMPFASLFRFATRQDKIMLFFGVLASIAVGVSLPINSILFGKLVNTIGSNTDLSSLVSDIVYYIRYVGAIAIVVMVSGTVQVSFFVITSERQTAALRLQLLKSVISQPISWFDTQNAGSLTSRMNDTGLVQDAISDKVGTIIQFMTQFWAGIIVGFVYGWQLSLVILSLMPLSMFAGATMGRFMQTIAIKTQAAYASAAAVADETILNPRTVQAFGAEERETQRYGISLGDAMKQGVNNGIVAGLSLGFMFCVMFGSYGLALWYGAKLIRDGASNGTTTYTGGDITTVFLSVMMGSQALGQIAPSFTTIAQGQAAAWYLFQIIDRVSEIDVFSNKGQKLIRPDAKQAAVAGGADGAANGNGTHNHAAGQAVEMSVITPKGSNSGGGGTSAVAGRIEFKDVHFTYATNPTKPILRGLSLTINPGEKVALVGASGCGKSTVVSLLERFYDPNQGAVFVDGVDLKDLNVRWWREQVGLVSQEPVLFAASIRDNILRGRPGATDADILAAARAANCHDFITALPEGYSTMCGDKGKLLSGGQKQRIAIARGLLKNPPLLLLDEATSALDAANEKDVQRALEVLMADRTTVIVAHRLATVRDCHRIFVVADGAIRESGTHDELMKIPGGAYAKLVAAQEQKTQEQLLEQKDEAKREEKAKREAILALQAAYLKKAEAKSKGLETKADATEMKQSAADAAQGAGQRGNSAPVVLDDAPEVSMFRMAAKVRPDWMWLAWGFVGAAAFGAVFPTFSFLLSGMINIFYDPDYDRMQRDAGNYALYFLAMSVGILIFIGTMQYAMAIVGERLTYTIRMESFRAIMRQNIGFFDEKKNLSGLLVTRLSQDATQVQNAVNRQLATVVQFTVTIICGLAIAFSYGWKLTLVILSVSPLIVFGGSFQFRGQFGFNLQSKQEFESANRLAAEAIGNIRTLVSFTGEQTLVDRFDQMLQRMIVVGTKSGLVQGVAFGFANAVVFAVYCLSFWYGSELISSGEIDFGQFLRVYFAISMTATSLGRSSTYMPDYVKARKATFNIFQLLDRVPTIDTWHQSVKPKLDAKQTTEALKEGGIEFCDVKFEYPTRQEVQVFSKLNLKVEPKTTVALVGASGCGKSTIIQLLQRFYDPVQGAIKIDGNDMRDYSISALRSRIGIVSQEPVLFSGTIEDNIKYGDPSASDEQMYEAARSANIHDFIMALEHKYKSKLGPKGIQLSGGEKQRVAIARAIIRRPTILLLDEATSALDSKSEREVQAAINNIMIGRTTIIVAHRLSTIRNAHQIVVFEHGEIKEQSTHDELIKRNGLYASLWALSSLERDPNQH